MNAPSFSQSCVSVFVEFADEGKDARKRGRETFEWTNSFVHLVEETNIDFRVSGLPYAVVKQAWNFRVREFVKKIQIQSNPRRASRHCSKIRSTTHLVTIR